MVYRLKISQQLKALPLVEQCVEYSVLLQLLTTSNIIITPIIINCSIE